MEKRITTEVAIASFAAAGVKPSQKCFFEYEGNLTGVKATCACGIGAIYIQSGGEARGNKAYGYAVSEYGEEYVDGFMAGFDGEDGCLFIHERELQGYKDGCAAWEAVKP